MSEKGIFSSPVRYVSLYRRYRPLRFEEVVGQDAAVSVLRRSLQTGKTVHAYLFSGPRGCGKTSLARILSKALNCTDDNHGAEPCGSCPSCLAITAGESLDVVEIDGASNRGIDEVRELKAHVSLAPFSSRRKVYIIDEVHMLTEPAFNALLKTLEEPPSHAVFILATTEPHKVPVTIRSRCQHIPFRRISGKDIATRLSLVCEKEGITADEAALWELARQADGAMRDALSLLEQAIPLGSGVVTIDSVRALLGGGSRCEMERFTASFRTTPDLAVSELMESLRKGTSMERILENLFLIFRDLWILKAWGETALEGLELSGEERAFLIGEVPFWTLEGLRACLDTLSRLISRVRTGMRTDVLAGLLLEGLGRAALASGPISEGAAMPLQQERTLPRDERIPRPSPVVPDPETQPSSDALPAIDIDAIRRFWIGLLESRDPEDRQIVAAIAPARVLAGKGGVEVDFPQRDRICYELIRLERNRRRFHVLKEGALGEIPFIFCCGKDRFLEKETPAMETVPAGEDPNGIPWLRRDQADDSERGKRIQETRPEAEPARGASRNATIEEMLSWFGGEILLVRTDDQEGGIGGFEEGSAGE
ncbi:MAG TPA: DNA polymerase III subunit gamma/tau [Synergistales bacterium]|nr:DNA polymerase III subunit gamma/tau [Synergistales bacterium]